MGRNTRPLRHYALAIGTLGRGPESPAKSAFIAQLIETYREPGRLAEAWGIPLSSWDELRSAGFALPPASLDSPAVIRDLTAFTRRFAEAYFRAVAEALHRHDPNHLDLGTRGGRSLCPLVRCCQLQSLPTIARQCPRPMATFPRTRQTGSDWRVSFRLDRSRPVLGRPCRSRQGERARPPYARYLRTVADNPDFVGAHWFQYIDEPLTGRTLDGENAHVGLVTVADLPYTEFVAATREANLSVLRALEQGADRGER